MIFNRLLVRSGTHTRESWLCRRAACLDICVFVGLCVRVCEEGKMFVCACVCARAYVCACVRGLVLLLLLLLLGLFLLLQHLMKVWFDRFL